MPGNSPSKRTGYPASRSRPAQASIPDTSSPGCALRGPEVFLDAEVQLDAVAAEPAPAARGKTRRLAYLLQPEHAGVELAQRRLAARRAGQLHMVDHGAVPSSYLDIKVTS